MASCIRHLRFKTVKRTLFEANSKTCRFENVANLTSAPMAVY